MKRCSWAIALLFTAMSAYADEKESAGAILERIVKDIELSGFVDTGIVVNPARPENGMNGAVPTGPSLVGFGQRANSFTLHNAQLTLLREATPDAAAGFRLELTTGRDADVIDATGDADNDQFDLQEAYVQILAPLGNGVDIKVGKFATLSGYEVIESKDDFNYTRSLNFMWSIPFTHTGVRAGYKPNDPVSLTLGVNNGWDNTDDNNNGKTAEFQLLVAPRPWVSGAATMYYGPERTEAGDQRFLLDLTGTLQPLDKLTLGGNIDWARDEDAAADGAALWSGWAAYAKYDFADWTSSRLRVERFNDRDGFRTGLEMKVWEATLTQEFKIAEGVAIRLEARRDKADRHAFLDEDDGKTAQQIFACEVICAF